MEKRESIFYRNGAEAEYIIKTVSSRYTGMNPPEPFTFCGASRNGLLWDEKGRICMNLLEKMPDSRQGQMALAAARVWNSSDEEKIFEIWCLGPVRLFVNGEMVFRSSVEEEVNVSKVKRFPIRLTKGWNDFVFSFLCTASGFGCYFAPDEPRWNWLPFESPFEERAGSLDYIYSEPFYGEFRKFEPDFDFSGSEYASGMTWYPDRRWPEEKMHQNAWSRVIGPLETGEYGYGYTGFYAYQAGTVTIEAASNCRIRLWLDDEAVLESDKEETISCFVKGGFHKMKIMLLNEMLETAEPEAEVVIRENGKVVPFEAPECIQGFDGRWMYLGPFKKETPLLDAQDLTLNRIYENGNDHTYWKLDGPDIMVRPCLQNELFGRWNYPLGVTLYGILQTGRQLKDRKLTAYAASHICACASMQPYALWDKSVYGYPQINNQLCSLSMLDDCGSFASAMLEAYEEDECEKDRAAMREIADRVAYHMEHVQERREDGAFYRICKDFFMENTMWADDLYMSVPFLIRYYRLTGDKACLDDGAEQFLLFKKYLFMEEKVMSHVYDFKYETPTKMPWGRGNGWVLFSLSELLAVLPQDHPRYQELLEFFQEFASGILKYQGKRGLWHQLLTYEDSYEETSCTAMFLYGFARGIRYGWLKDEKGQYRSAVEKAWEGLARYAIDRQGNVYGVCRGSQYSFTPDYYKYDLTARDNDTHGIGIVLLAGIEKMKLDEYYKK